MLENRMVHVILQEDEVNDRLFSVATEYQTNCSEPKCFIFNGVLSVTCKASRVRHKGRETDSPTGNKKHSLFNMCYNRSERIYIFNVHFPVGPLES